MDSLYRSLFRDQKRNYMDSITRPVSNKVYARQRYLQARNLLYKSYENREHDLTEHIIPGLNLETKRNHIYSVSPTRDHSRCASPSRVDSLRRLHSRSPTRDLLKLEKCGSRDSLKLLQSTRPKSRTPGNDRYATINGLIEKYKEENGIKNKEVIKSTKSFSEIVKTYEISNKKNESIK